MSVAQYLQHYAEPETHQFSGLDFYYENILAIPVFNESELLISRLKGLYTKQALLIILVVNAPDNLDSQDPAIKTTQAFSQLLKQQCTKLKKYTPTMHLLELCELPRRHILLVERCSKGYFIPAKEGVGLARKIACDLACDIIASGRINSYWIHSTDADATLPSQYFEVTQTIDPTEVAVATYPFQHTHNEDSNLHLCQLLYDLSLEYYVQGLRWANSPYAYHTVGSTLLINFHAYGLVRGFPKRAAGEDFYLLNKIAKFSEILTLDKPVIMLDSRLSERVPFGTGPALIKIFALEHPLKEYTYYNPLCFDYLKVTLEIFPQIWEQRITEFSHASLESLLQHCSLRVDTDILKRCLESLKANTALVHAHNNSKSQESFLKHLHNWFDGFRTLKFIHFLRDHLREQQQPPLTAHELKQQAVFLTDELTERLNSLA